MDVSQVEATRNVVLASCSGVGKTSLAEALLFFAGATESLGLVDKGTSILDSEAEEVEKKITMNTRAASLSWKSYRITLVDTPGYSIFLADSRNSLRAVDGAIFVISALSELRVEAQRVWEFLRERNLPTLIFVNKMDRERADMSAALEDLNKTLGVKAIPAALPIGRESSLQGTIDLISRKASMEGSGKAKETEIPKGEMENTDKARNALIEAIAETDDALLEKYLDGASLSQEEISQTFKRAVLQGKIFPAYCGSAIKGVGLHQILTAMTELLPSPAEAGKVTGKNPVSQELIERKPTPQEPFSAWVFKTFVDPFAGKINLLRVYSGSLNSDSTVYNSSKEVKERIAQIYQMKGKKQEVKGFAQAGDIVAVMKLKDTLSGDALCDEKAPIIFDGFWCPLPIISCAVTPRGKTDEDKIAANLTRLLEEDPTLELKRDQQTKEILLGGMGQDHLELAVQKLKRKFGVEADLTTPKVPYKETIRIKAQAQGKYKRQSGGRGQYGDCWLELEPLPRGKGYEFVDKIVGGVIPRNYIPAVEKGVKETMAEGVLAGFPVVDVKVSLFDGSYHIVDSSDIAFKIAGSLGFRKAAEQAHPVILEPVMSLEVIVPEEYTGEIIGDLNSRRGKIKGMRSASQSQVISALVPMAEILRYASDIKSKTQGRGTFTLSFSHYEEVPAHIQEKIVAQRKKEKEEERKDG